MIASPFLSLLYDEMSTSLKANSEPRHGVNMVSRAFDEVPSLESAENGAIQPPAFCLEMDTRESPLPPTTAWYISHLYWWR